jgi:hypothetical protein
MKPDLVTDMLIILALQMYTEINSMPDRPEHLSINSIIVEMAFLIFRG